MNKWSLTFQWCLLAIAATIPSGLYQLTLMFVAIGGVCWIVQKQFRNLFTKTALIAYLFPLLYYLVIVVSYFFANDKREALHSLSAYLPLIIYPFLLSGADPKVLNRSLLQKTELVFLFSTVITSLWLVGYAAIDILKTNNSSVIINQGAYSKFASFGLTRAFDDYHPTYYSMFLNLSLGIAISNTRRAYREGLPKKSLFYLGLVCFLIIMLFLANSMIGILSMVLIFAYYIMLYLKSVGFSLSRQAMILTGFLVITAGFLYFNPLKLYKIESLHNRGLKPTDKYLERNLLTIRLAKWESHWQIVKQYPLFGATQGDIKATRLKIYNEKGYMDLAKHNYNAHNQYLEILSTNGLLGLLFFAGMIAVAFSKSRPGHFYILMLVFFITCLTESIMERQQGLNFFMFFYSIYTVPFLTQHNPDS